MSSDTTTIGPDAAPPKKLRGGPKVNATRMTFILSLLCLCILGYSAILYIHLSFREIPDVLSIPYFVVRQRTALSALAMAIAISCIIMGFAVFMIGAKGEINFKAESSAVKGALVSGVPGPFFVLCGTVITVAVLFVRVSYEEGASSSKGATPGLSASTSDNSIPASRTIASSATQRSALYMTQTALYNDLMSIAVEDHPEDAVQHLVTNESDISVVLIDWDDQNKRPLSFEGSDTDNHDSRVSVSEGYLFVLNDDNAGSIKSLLKAANDVSSEFPAADHLPAENILRVVKAALGGRVVFSHGEVAQ